MAPTRQVDNKNNSPSESGTTKVNETPSADKKSGLRSLNSGDVLFHDGDAADSLFIIQKGQLRLYKPKGKGFIELAVLRAGEVLGEMAYFAEDPAEGRRSCSAAAMIRTEVIEISFVAFGKTMNNLNPWFKTIINTLASRLRKTNSKVKELESNSVAMGYGGSVAGYQFFKTIDIIRLLSTYFLVFKAQGEPCPEGVKLHKNNLKFYALEIYNLQEVKFEEFADLLLKLNLVTVTKDKDNLPNIYLIQDTSILKSILTFLSSQRIAADDKKIKISDRCEIFLEKIIKQIREKNVKQTKIEVDLNLILNEFKEKNIHISIEDLKQAKDAGFVSEVIVADTNRLTCTVDYDRLISLFLPLRVMNAVDKVNESKSKQ